MQAHAEAPHKAWLDKRLAGGAAKFHVIRAAGYSTPRSRRGAMEVEGAPHDCPGVQAEEAGRAAACAGCPNQVSQLRSTVLT
jgi:hypothetical protein